MKDSLVEEGESGWRSRSKKVGGGVGGRRGGGGESVGFSCSLTTMMIMKTAKSVSQRNIISPHSCLPKI